MPDHDDIPDLPPEELLAAEEELLGGPKPMSAETGFDAMSQRISYLEQQLSESLHHLDGGEEPSPAISQMIAQLRKELAQARQRLREYQVQRDGLN